MKIGHKLPQKARKNLSNHNVCELDLRGMFLLWITSKPTWSTWSKSLVFPTFKMTIKLSSSTYGGTMYTCTSCCMPTHGKLQHLHKQSFQCIIMFIQKFSLTHAWKVPTFSQRIELMHVGLIWEFDCQLEAHDSFSTKFHTCPSQFHNWHS